MLYPLKFQPVYKDYLWGGRNLANWGKQLPETGIVAESWEISAHPNGLSIIANGELAGISLPEAIRRLGRSLAGTLIPDRDLNQFPLLIKLIDAQDRLSVQVHPDDAYARLHQAAYGKNEMWYIVAAQPGARLIAGVKPGVGPEEFAAAIAAGRCLDLLLSLEVRAGDAINIPAGLVHAIGQGLVICEIQQNSDITYRVCDYDRTDSLGRKRPLHIEQALAVIDYSRRGNSPRLSGLLVRNQMQPALSRRVLVLNRCFLVEELAISGIAGFQADGRRFRTLTVLEGQGELVYSEKSISDRACLALRQGDSLLIPACLGPWQISGQLKIIAGSVADFTADLQQLAWETGLSGRTIQELLAAWSGQIGFEPLP